MDILEPVNYCIDENDFKDIWDQESFDSVSKIYLLLILSHAGSFQTYGRKFWIQSK